MLKTLLKKSQRSSFSMKLLMVIFVLNLMCANAYDTTKNIEKTVILTEDGSGAGYTSTVDFVYIASKSTKDVYQKYPMTPILVVSPPATLASSYTAGAQRLKCTFKLYLL